MTSRFAFSKETIDSESLPVVPEALFPWLRKDLEEAKNGSIVKDQNGNAVHDGTGLEKAKQSLRAAETRLSENKDSSLKVIEFLNEQKAMAIGKISFYEGKIYLLSKILSSK